MKTYAGIPVEYAGIKNAKIVLLPVAYDGTSTWQKGADKGPEAFLEASENMELYDIETGSVPYKNGVYLAEQLGHFYTPDKMVEQVEIEVEKHLQNEKFVTLFGGEHSVSIGSIRAFGKKHKDLSVLQIDAHTDLRPEYEGSPYNHACAVYEASQQHNLVQVGIRSMDHSELEFVTKEKTFFAHEIQKNPNWHDGVLQQLGETVYITIDLDGFDPSIAPATGTPEPGGLQWYDTLAMLKKVFKHKNVVGFDIVELCPNSNEKSTDFLAAKLYYKLLAYKFNQENINT